MFCKNKKVNIELFNANKHITINKGITNSIKGNNKTIIDMVNNILDNELPMISKNSLWHEMIKYTVIQKVTTVQNVKNVLSCIKKHGAKKVYDINFTNGEVCVKCSI